MLAVCMKLPLNFTETHLEFRGKKSAARAQDGTEGSGLNRMWALESGSLLGSNPSILGKLCNLTDSASVQMGELGQCDEYRRACSRHSSAQ